MTHEEIRSVLKEIDSQIFKDTGDCVKSGEIEFEIATEMAIDAITPLRNAMREIDYFYGQLNAVTKKGDHK